MCLFLTNRATQDSTLLDCPKPFLVEIAFSGILLCIFISGNLLQLWEGSCYGKWLFTEYYHSSLLLLEKARVILGFIGVSWVSQGTVVIIISYSMMYAYSYKHTSIPSLRTCSIHTSHSSQGNKTPAVGAFQTAA